MDNIKQGFLSRLIGSLQMNNFYILIRNEKLSKALKFFYLLIFILTSLLWIKYTFGFYTAYNIFTDEISPKIPNFTFAQGQLEIDIKEATLYSSDSYLFLIDPYQEYSETELDNYSTGLYITSRYMVFKKNQYDTQTYPFKDFKELSFTKSQTISFIKKWSKITFIIIVILSFLLTFIGKTVGLLFISLLGLMMNAILKTKHIYNALFKTSVYVMVLPMLLKTLSMLFGLTIPFFFILYYGLVIFYFYKTLPLIGSLDTAESNTNDSTILSETDSPDHL